MKIEMLLVFGAGLIFSMVLTSILIPVLQKKQLLDFVTGFLSHDHDTRR